MVNENLNKTIELFESVPAKVFEEKTGLSNLHYYDNKLSGNIQGMKGFSELDFGRHSSIGG